MWPAQHLSGQQFLRRLPAEGSCKRGGGYPQAYLDFQSTQQQNSNGYPHVFGIIRSNGTTSGIAWRGHPPEIQNGSRQNEMSI